MDDEEFILAKDLIPTVFKMPGVNPAKDVRIIQTFKGAQLVGRKYEPLFNYAAARRAARHHEVVTADFVTLDTGTGIVHIAPAFGEDDYRLSREKGLGFLQLVAPDGTFTPEVTDFAGRFCKEADADIIHLLKARGQLLKREQYRHEYPFCWRAEEDPLIQYAQELVHPHDRVPRRVPREQREDQLAARAHPRGPLRQLPRGQRGLGPVARAVLGHAAAGLGVRADGQAGGRRFL